MSAREFLQLSLTGKTSFDILMSSSVPNELFNGCTFEFYLKPVRYKITRQIAIELALQFEYEIRGKQK